jgi:ATP-binding cassette subfamily C protein
VSAHGHLLPVASAADTRRAVRSRLRPYRLLLIGAVALFVARALVGLIGPAVFGRIVDVVVDGGPTSSLTTAFVVLAIAAVVEAVLAWVGPIVAAHAAEPALADLREEVVDRALHVPLSDVERAGTGDLVARVDGDVGVASAAIREAFPLVAEAGLTIGLTVVGLALLDWRLGLAGLCAAPIQLHTVRWYLPRSNPVYAAERVAASERSQQLVESLGGASTVQALDESERHTGLVGERSQRAVDLALRGTWLRTRFFARLNLAEAVGLGAILATGFLLHRAGDVSVGAVTAAALYFQRLFDPINTLLYLIDEAQSGVAALARLVGVAEMAPDRHGPAERPGDGGVAMTDLCYSYERGHQVVHGVDLCVADSRVLAVVGATGAGKSTLAKLVAGVHRPDSGTVTIGGVDVTAAAERDGRPPVVLVTQEVHVFAGTLADDLRLARPSATDGELGAALATVGASSWVATLPDGLETVVGDGGHFLDATHAQHVALARLVLADPLVAVLDEATAEAGSAGARVLERAAAAAVSSRTAVVVAHRLSQASASDEIVVVDGGRVVEAGPHDSLVAADGAYADLWRAWHRDRAHAPADGVMAPTTGVTM